MKNIIICAAKTGGHIFPALGFAKEALKNDYKITFLGTNTDLEKKIFQQNENIDFIKFELDGFRGKSITQKLIFLIKLPLIFFQVISIIISRKISSVVCFGGFITVPVGFASIISLRKLYLHEQNSVVGSSNRLLSLFAEKMFTAFPISKNKKYFFIGNPSYIQNKKVIDINQNDNLNILITGGSQGADFINKNIHWYVTFDRKPLKWAHTSVMTAKMLGIYPDLSPGISTGSLKSKSTSFNSSFKFPNKYLNVFLSFL